MSIEMHAELLLTSPCFNPPEVTARLGISPDRTWIKGDSVQGTGAKRPHCGWCLSTAADAGPDLELHVKALLARLLPVKHKFLQLRQQLGMVSELSCVVYVGDETPSVSFDAQTLEDLATLKVSLDIDLILIDPLEESP